MGNLFQHVAKICAAIPVITSFEHPICCPDAVLNCTGTVLSRCTSLESSCLTTSLKANSTMACERAVQNLAALLACLPAYLQPAVLLNCLCVHLLSNGALGPFQ